jgi:mono/diheme cytochrome c family protein
MARLTLLSFVFAIGVPAIAAQPRTGQAAPPAGDARTLSRSAIDGGRALYARHCSHCHGFNMVNPGNVSFDLRQFPRGEKARFADSVANGKNGRMPPWKSVLSPQDIEELWAYVRSGGKR